MSQHTPWEGGRCQVPMWMGGLPAGHCDRPAFGPQLPDRYLNHARGGLFELAYCVGPCCPGHGGPREGDPIVFEDGLTSEGRPMWCAVMPGFINLQESPAGFNADPIKAVAKLRALKATGTASPPEAHGADKGEV